MIDASDATESRLLTPKEVGELFGVGPKTVSRWARTRKLRSVRTLGGHFRFYADDVNRLLESARSTE
jgi:excisionase family DNA binding protein